VKLNERGLVRAQELIAERRIVADAAADEDLFILENERIKTP
jgi:hypothetical protein